ncbi:uncharacterized protein PSFLO_03515 [Pseudozyma flocculosa]|uniref:Uncharacterized protein n=1 Tax=Pseudozyma flocculosa TaxID=84751 RepID=A0A5C3F0S9_9BASI|nr:uncharacterized protein PSFLO_03515 [Pseudozyma flocculosa]
MLARRNLLAAFAGPLPSNQACQSRPGQVARFTIPRCLPRHGAPSRSTHAEATSYRLKPIHGGPSSCSGLWARSTALASHTDVAEPDPARRRLSDMVGRALRCNISICIRLSKSGFLTPIRNYGSAPGRLRKAGSRVSGITLALDGKLKVPDRSRRLASGSPLARLRPSSVRLSGPATLARRVGTEACHARWFLLATTDQLVIRRRQLGQPFDSIRDVAWVRRQLRSGS